ncbi:uncharacterized protein [Miscanthus floridulus]|uniref:uncharacterized protein n=1 Tax=Miscanthus floridulus TaxID=154761 RepID=UPI00345897B2
MAALAAAAGLRELVMDKCLGVTDVGLAKVAVGCPGLEKLSVKWCREISDIGIERLAKKCPCGGGWQATAPLRALRRRECGPAALLPLPHLPRRRPTRICFGSLCAVDLVQRCSSIRLPHVEKRVTRRGALALLERAAFAATAMAPQRSYQYLHADALKVFNEMNTRVTLLNYRMRAQQPNKTREDIKHLRPPY